MKKALAILLSILLLVACVPLGAISVSAVADGDNLVVNGGFENGNEGWILGSSASITTEDAYKGSASLKLENPNAWSEAATQTVAVKANTEYVIEMYTKRVGAVKGVFNLFLMNKANNANLTIVEGQNWFNTKNESWEKKTIIINTGDATELSIKWSAEAYNAGTLLIDNMSINEKGVIPETPAGPTMEVVAEPDVNIAYKFGMIQGNVSASDVYYLTGSMNGYYMDTATNVTAAIDVYLENAEGGYYMYTLINGAKTYINMVVSGIHVNGAYEAAASTVYTFNADSKTVIAIVNDTEYWFGTRNDKTYTTVGPVKVEYADFYCQFYAELPSHDHVYDDATDLYCNLCGALADDATSGVTGDCTWTLRDGHLTISGNGAMGNYTGADAPWGTSITSVTIADGVTAIGSKAFYASAVQSIIISDSVTAIGNEAFHLCASLIDVWYTGTAADRAAMSIGGNNRYLTDATWHYNVCPNEHTYDNECDTTCNLCNWWRTVTHQYADATCTAPQTCIFCGDKYGEALGHTQNPESDCLNVTCVRCEKPMHTHFYSIDWDYYTLSCSKCPTPLTFRYNVNENGEAVITDAWASGTLIIPSEIDGFPVTTIGAGAFEGEEFFSCYASTIILSEGITTIEEEAFHGNTYVKNIVLPKSLTTIEDRAFSPDYEWLGHLNLETVTYNGSKSDWEKISIGDNNSQLLSATRYYAPCEGEHVYTNNCDAICDECENETREPNHSYDNACDSNCNVCDAWREVADHAYDSDCDPDCNICGAVRSSAHTYDDCNDAGCDICGAVRETPAHTYDGSYDAICNICGAVREIGSAELNTNITINITRPGQNVRIPFIPEESGYYIFQSYGNHDTKGYIYEEGNGQIAYNDDGGDYTNFLIEHYLYAGHTYDLGACFYSNSTTGNITVRISRVQEGFLYTVSDGKATITGYRGYLPSDLVIPEAIDGYPVVAIGSRAFYWRNELQSVTLSDTVTTIVYGAFSECYNLETVQLGDSVTTLDEYAFSNCENLNTISIPDTLTYVGSNAFRSCYWLTDVYYAGNIDDRWNINIVGYNDRLYEATWHYNYCFHVYDDICDEDCNKCGEVREDVHDFFSACDRDCHLCGLVRQAPHDYDGVCDTTCNECGAHRKAAAHTYDNACDDTCNGCGLTRRVPSHVYDDVCDEICNECGHIRNENIHVYDNICDADCNRCGATRRVDGHIYDDVCDPDCNRCGTLREAQAHVYSDACDIDCNVCDAMRTPPHVYTNDADNECNVCGILRTPEILPDDTPLFVVDDVEVQAGETFTVAIRTENNPGITSLKLRVYYDTWMMDLVDYCEVDFAGVSYGPEWNHPFVVNWYNAIQPDNHTDGTVVLLTFRMSEWVQPGATTTISVGYDDSDVFNADWEPVWFETVSGTVTVQETTYGDANGDGSINNRDLAMMQQYLNGWDVDASVSACDVNGDGNVNNRDLALFQQYLNGWDVNLG